MGQAAERDDKQGSAVVDPFAAAMTEDELQENVRALSKLLRLDYYHTHDSRHSPEGFPDCVIVRGDELIVRELKDMRRKKTGEFVNLPTPAQLRWLAAFGQVRRVSAGIWRPDAWRNGLIENTLRGHTW